MLCKSFKIFSDLPPEMGKTAQKQRLANAPKIEAFP